MLGTTWALVSPASLAAGPQQCTAAAVVLWGDGRHDDTKALNAWFGGKNALWGESGGPVGDAIVGHRFRLSSAIYVRGGTGRQIRDFEMFWPRRGEIVTGGTIRAGKDLNAAPIISGVSIRNGDSGEGKPFATPNPSPRPRDNKASCATS